MFVVALVGCVPNGIDGFFVRLEGAVADEAGAAVAGATVALAAEDGTSLGEAVTDEAGRWTFPLFALDTTGNRVNATVSATGFSTGLAGWDVNLLSAETARLTAGPNETWETTPRVLATVRLADEGTAGVASGVVTDPLGNPVGGLPFVVLQGWDAEVGAAALGSGETGGSGEFSATVDAPGLYTIQIAPSGGWAGSRFPVLATTSGDSIRATVAALQEPGDTLVTLTWEGATDLDLHLSGPEVEAEADANRFHVWVDDPVHPERLVDDDEYLAEVLRSETSGPGPECIVVNRAPGVGELWLSVADRTNQATVGSTVLAGSRALVQWWNGEDTPRYAWVSPLEVATSWRPVEIDTRGGTVYAVERYDEGLDPAESDDF